VGILDFHGCFCGGYFWLNLENAMKDKTKAILTITAPDGVEFDEKGAVLNQSSTINGVCIELFIPTKPIEASDKLIAQSKADEKAFPQTWFMGWEWLCSGKWVKADSNFSVVRHDGCQYHRLHHADLIMQCEQDKIDYPDFWSELWQVKLSSGKWISVARVDFTFHSELKYRQHPHRKSIIEWHKCSDEDKKRWQWCVNNGNSWIDCSTLNRGDIYPRWYESEKYRLSPRTCQVTINGTVLEYPEPCREPLEIESMAFLVNPIMGEITEVVWRGCRYSKKYLDSGMLHLTQQAAEQHLAVLQAINAQVAI
jgi:hypothetical protein